MCFSALPGQNTADQIMADSKAPGSYSARASSGRCTAYLVHGAPVPTVNLKRLTATAILAPDGRSLQVDLVPSNPLRRGRTASKRVGVPKMMAS